MDIKDCKIGTRVICTNPDHDNVIPLGAMGTIIENDSTIPWVSFDDNYYIEQQEVFGYKNCKVMELEEIEVLKEGSSKGTSSEETNIGKLTVSLATEDLNSVAKDILKVVLQELFVGIENLSKDLDEVDVSGDVTPKESLVTEKDVLNNLLYCINLAVNNKDEDTALKLSQAYGIIKSVSINTARSK